MSIMLDQALINAGADKLILMERHRMPSFTWRLGDANRAASSLSLFFDRYLYILYGTMWYYVERVSNAT